MSNRKSQRDADEPSLRLEKVPITASLPSLRMSTISVPVTGVNPAIREEPSAGEIRADGQDFVHLRDASVLTNVATC